MIELRTEESTDELTVTVRTHWNGGAVDKHPENNEHEVLVPASGEPTVF